MTIKIDRSALLTVLSRAPIEDKAYQHQCKDDDIDYRIEQDLHEDDASFDASSTVSEAPKRVSFCDSLVTDEWTRPYTSQEEIADLYYSTLDTQR